MGAFSMGLKWLECEADRSPPSSAEVKNAEALCILVHLLAWHFFKHEDVTLYLLIIIIITINIIYNTLLL
jgi:hypothetical protein